MGLPLAATRLIHTFGTFVVMVLLAQLGNDVLAASFTIAITRVVILVIFMSPLFVTGAIVGRQFKSSNGGCVQILYQAWLTALLLSIPPIGVLTLLEPILGWFNQPAELIPIISGYFKYYMWAIPGIYLATVNYQYLSGIHQQKWVLWLNILTLVVSISLNAALIFGVYFIPALGVKGAGMASIISSWVSFALSVCILRKYSAIHLGVFLMRDFSWGKKIFRIGIPLGLRSGSDMGLMFVIMLMIGWLGETVMSASQISNEYMMLGLLPLVGIGEACAIVAGHAIGEENHATLRLLNKAAIILTTSITLVMGLIVFAFHRPLSKIFIVFSGVDSYEIYRLAIILLAMSVLRLVFAGPIQTLGGLLRGVYDTKYPMWASFFTGWGITLPLAVYFAFVLNWGVIGIVLSPIVAELILIFILSKRWKMRLLEIE